MPPIHVKNSGIIKEASEVYVKDNGSWKEAQEVYVRQNGVWQLVHTSGYEINTSTGYTSITGLTYDEVLTNTTSQDHIDTNVTIPAGTTSIDYIIIGSGGAGGRLPSATADEWVGSGGCAAPILIGRVDFTHYGGTQILECSVGGQAIGYATDGTGIPGMYSRIKYGSTYIESPGGFGGFPGNGQHGRPMYMGQIKVLPELKNTGTSSSFNYLDITTSTSFVDTTRTVWVPRYSNIVLQDGTIYSSSASSPSTDETLLDTGYFAATVWRQDTEWAMRVYSGGTYTSYGSALPYHPDDKYQHTSLSNFSFSVIAPSPPQRATGYAGTFRGETNANGVIQNQSFSRTSGANGSGTSLTSWANGEPVRKGASNGTDYGKGGSAVTAYNSLTSAQLDAVRSTGGLIMLKFNS